MTAVDVGSVKGVTRIEPEHLGKHICEAGTLHFAHGMYFQVYFARATLEDQAAWHLCQGKTTIACMKVTKKWRWLSLDRVPLTEDDGI